MRYGFPVYVSSHPIKAVQPRKTESTDHVFRSSVHVILCNQTQHAGRSSRILLVEYLKMEADQHDALPASYQAGCLAARHKYLRINEGVPAHMHEMADAR